MTSNERKTTEKQAAVLLNDLDPAIAASVVDRFGDIHSMEAGSGGKLVTCLPSNDTD